MALSRFCRAKRYFYTGRIKMKQLLEASYDETTDSCNFTLQIDDKIYPFRADIIRGQIEGEPTLVFRYKPTLSNVVPISEQSVWRGLGFCLRIIVRTKKKLEIPVNFENDEDPGFRALYALWKNR
jgi:hypothetical protein